MNIGLLIFQRLLFVGGLILNVLGVTLVTRPLLYAQQSQSSYVKPSTGRIPALPLPLAKVPLAVQKFRNFTTPTGQGKPGLSKSDDLPAVDENNSAIFLKELNESGWFTTSEVSNVTRLLNKRDSSKTALLKSDGSALPLSDFFLEGGVLANDMNTFMDEKGVQYFGKAGKKPYQSNQVTVYLRLISTQSGKILKTVYKSKTLFSQSVGDNSYQFVTFKAPFEAETGIIAVPPDQFLMTQVIKQSVQGLIIEGIRDGLWKVADNPAFETSTLLQQYDQEINQESEIAAMDSQPSKSLFGIPPQMNAPFISVHPYWGGIRYAGDYTQRETRRSYGLSLEMYLAPIIGIQVNGSTGTLASKDAFTVNLTSLEVSAILRPLPYQRLTPLLIAGAGMVSRSGSSPFQLKGEKYGQAQVGVGVQYTPNAILGFRSMVLMNQPFTDELDGKVMGSHKDYYTRLTVGLVFHIGRFLVKTKTIKFTKVAP